MSDNDFLCRGIGRAWHGAFTLLYEWQQSETWIARATLQALKTQLQRFGNPPLWYLDSTASRFAELSSPLAQGAADWEREHDAIVRQTRDYRGHKRAMNLAQHVACLRLENIRHRRHLDNHREDMTRGYVERVYDAMYVAPVTQREPMSERLPPDIVTARLNALHPYVSEGIDNFTGQLLDRGDVEKLRMPRQRRQPVDDNYLYENIGLN